MRHPHRRNRRHCRHHRRGRFAGRLGWGLILIAMGFVFTLDEFGLMEQDRLWRFAPSILLVLGVVKLTRSEERSGGLWLLAVGAWLQVTTLGLWGLDFHNSWPLLLIGVGVVVIVQSLIERRDDESGGQPEAPEGQPAAENGHAS